MARKVVAQRLWLQASYVYSSLRGNFDGGVYEALGQTDAETVVPARAGRREQGSQE